jgi:hypothetical protein
MPKNRMSTRSENPAMRYRSVLPSVGRAIPRPSRSEPPVRHEGTSPLALPDARGAGELGACAPMSPLGPKSFEMGMRKTPRQPANPASAAECPGVLRNPARCHCRILPGRFKRECARLAPCWPCANRWERSFSEGLRIAMAPSGQKSHGSNRRLTTASQRMALIERENAAFCPDALEISPGPPERSVEAAREEPPPPDQDPTAASSSRMMSSTSRGTRA